MNYLNLKSYRGMSEIIELINKGSSFDSEIWQTDTKSRLISKILKVEMDRELSYFTIQTLDHLSFNKTSPLFFRFAYRNIIFKSSPGQFDFSGERLFCNLPKEVMALEARKDSRYVLSNQSGVSITLRRGERTIKEIVHDLEVRVIDVSESGFGVVISGANKNLIGRYDYIWLKAIDQRPLSTHIFGTISYITDKSSILKRGEVRVGLSLQTKLKKEILESLQRRSYLTLAA
ncbi:MAG: hypothetical protein AB7I27_02440 [Bacteriovoracaceae bacterium]